MVLLLFNQKLCEVNTVLIGIKYATDVTYVTDAPDLIASPIRSNEIKCALMGILSQLTVVSAFYYN